MFKIEIDTAELDKLRQKLENLPEQQSVPLSELLPPNYMAQNTDAPNVEAFLLGAGFGVTKESFPDLPSAELDTYTRAHTRFDSWSDLQADAAKEYITRQLRL
ncbi:MAG: hypothetical protein M3Z54_03105 [Gemmatimonadota bacterium]|nr:hypothetical protein [Gemmatimonadota bacterium]